MANTTALFFGHPAAMFAEPQPIDYPAVLMPYTAIADLNPPVVTLVSPLTPTIGRFDAVIADIADLFVLRRVTVWVEYPSGDWETAFARGVFAPRFSTSTMADVQPGLSKRMTLRRQGGWPHNSLSIHVEPIDAAGNAG